MKKIFVLQSQYSKRIITASKSILKIKKYILEHWFVNPEEKQKFLDQEKNYKNLGYSLEKFLGDNCFQFDLVFHVYDD